MLHPAVPGSEVADPLAIGQINGPGRPAASVVEFELVEAIDE
jgi:hypothetical protein